MYYFYERWWGRIAWGGTDHPDPVSTREKWLWTLGTCASLGVVFYLLLVVTPMIKGK